MRKQNARRSEEALQETLASAPVQVARHLRRVTKTRAWLTVQPSTINVTEMGVQKCRDDLFLCFILYPPDLTKLCDV